MSTIQKQRLEIGASNNQTLSIFLLHFVCPALNRVFLFLFLIFPLSIKN